MPIRRRTQYADTFKGTRDGAAWEAMVIVRYGAGERHVPLILALLSSAKLVLACRDERKQEEERKARGAYESRTFVGCAFWWRWVTGAISSVARRWQKMSNPFFCAVNVRTPQ